MEQHVAVPVRLPTPAWPEPMRAGALAMIQQVSKWRKSVFPGELPAQAAPWVRDLGISHNRRRISGRVVRVGSTLRPPFRGFLQARDRATGCAPGRYGAVSGVWPGVLAVIDEVLPVLSLRADPQGRRSNLLFGSTRLLRRLRRLAMTGSDDRHRRQSLVGQMSADRVGGRRGGVQRQGEDSLGERVAPSPDKTSPTAGEAWRGDTAASRFRESPDGRSLHRRFRDTPARPCRVWRAAVQYCRRGPVAPGLTSGRAPARARGAARQGCGCRGPRPRLRPSHRRGGSCRVPRGRGSAHARSHRWRSGAVRSVSA